MWEGHLGLQGTGAPVKTPAQKVRAFRNIYSSWHYCNACIVFYKNVGL